VKLVKITPIKAFRDNYIWTIYEGESAWVIDPGESGPVLEFLEKQKLKLEGIFLTHHHNDHSGGIRELVAKFKDLSVVAGYKSKIQEVNHQAHDGDSFPCAQFNLKAIEIPGHTLDHTAFYGNGWVFTGDTLFSAGCGRVFEGTHAMMYASLQKLVQLPGNTNVFCGHEYTKANLKFAQEVEPDNLEIKNKLKSIESITCTLPSTVEEELKINPFLRCEVPSVIAAAENMAGQKLKNAVEIFGVLREWKNNF
jgi:hydroxyacylglutathione hydrolase